MTGGRSTLAALQVIGMLTLAGAAKAAIPCGALARTDLGDARILSAEAVPEGAYRPAPNDQPLDLPGFCRVTLEIRPVPDSRIGTEIWLPSDGWNGKMEMVGNGGYDSALAYHAMAPLLRAGYAVVATDTGHRGADPDFAAGHPEAILDWGQRAVHLSAVRGKQVVTDYFGTPPRHSYFSGCSTGGHQAMMEAQRYPDDFDGIIAGASGGNRIRLNAGFLWEYLRNHRREGGASEILPAGKLAMVSAAALADCRADNGHRAGGLPDDDWLNDPLACRFDPGTLRCAGAETPSCLTDEQVQVVRAIYDGPRNPRTGDRIIFGYPPGSEAAGGPTDHPGWSLYWADPKDPATPARANFWRVWAGMGADWQGWWNFDFDRDVAGAETRLAATVDAVDPDLEGFRTSGGKLIAFHGLADPVVPVRESIAYYDRVVAGLEGRGALPADEARSLTDAFYRLFLVPGMHHCGGGPGPTEPAVQSALELWVERGIPPDRILANHPGGRAGSPAFSRPLCPYPQQAYYDGAGPPAQAESFRCRMPPRP